MEKIILTDCDGVLLNWEYAFNVWIQSHGYKMVEGGANYYDMGKRYGLSKEKAKEKCKIFNESAAIGFLPSLRDSMYYVKRLHEEHGYTFHCITSLSLDPSAGKLRKMNLEKMFGPTAFTKLVCLDTGADKDEFLDEHYADTGYYWIEDKMENAIAGLNLGLQPILIEHGHNMNDSVPVGMKKVVKWKEIYEYIISNE
jgi:hypothetical protein